MTNEELDAVERRMNAATPGPWAWSENCLDYDAPEAHFVELVTVSNPSVGDSTADGTGPPFAFFNTVMSAEMHHPKDSHAYCCVEIKKVDAAFIGYARTDVPALIAEVRRLKAKCGETE